MLTEMVQGRSATEIAALPKEELLEEIGIPLTPVRLKCAILGLGVLKVALHRAKGTPLPEEWSTLADELEFGGASIDVGAAAELPPNSVKIVNAGSITVGVYNLNGEFFALEDRCSHDDGPLCEGDFDPDTGVAICPRHGANIDIRTGEPLNAAGDRAGRDVPGAGRGRHRQGRGRVSEVVRCWQTTTPRYNAYHDEEWGRPVRDERGLYERLCLEGFQSGLSWLTILRKRENFRAAFAGSNPRRSRASASVTSSGCSATPASSATAARSKRRSRTRARRSSYASRRR